MPLIGTTGDLDRLSQRLAIASERCILDTATEAAPILQAYIRSQCAAGIGPYGQPWKPRKDGATAMQRPGQTVIVLPVGGSLAFQVEDVFQWHDQTRPVLPDGVMPFQWKTIVDGAYYTVLDRSLKP